MHYISIAVLGACGAGEHTCYQDLFLEALVECIPEDQVTDGKNDCGMNSDEGKRLRCVNLGGLSYPCYLTAYEHLIVLL